MSTFQTSQKYANAFRQCNGCTGTRAFSTETQNKTARLAAMETLTGSDGNSEFHIEANAISRTAMGTQSFTLRRTQFPEHEHAG